MIFRTEFPIPSSSYRINHQTNLLSIGSCFAETIATKLKDGKFKVLSNPFGIHYNPISIFNTIDPDFHYQENNFLERDGKWFHFDAHSSLYGNSKEELKQSLETISDNVQKYMAHCQCIIITFGTAYIYKKNSGETVSNCHKTPSHNFFKTLLEGDQILSNFHSLYHKIKTINPDLHIIFTVSPVRHLKDTIPLNSVSKSILRIACHHIQEKYEDVDYFPSYELMTDDLRDYRFYKDDMIHPTALAEAYIWGKFSKAYFSSETIQMLSQWEEILKALNHKPFHPGSSQHLKFLQQTITKIEGLTTHMDISSELELLRLQLKRTINS